MENQHAPAPLASTESLAEDLTDDEVSFSTDENIFLFAQEMAKGKVIMIYISSRIYENRTIGLQEPTHPVKLTQLK